MVVVLQLGGQITFLPPMISSFQILLHTQYTGSDNMHCASFLRPVTEELLWELIRSGLNFGQNYAVIVKTDAGSELTERVYLRYFALRATVA
jgi:hypothetical protein